MEKYNKLLEYIKNLHSVAVAFSGGVDSAFLLKAAKEAVGDRVLAVTVSSCLMPKREIKEAKEFCKTQGIEQIICDIDPFLADGFSANPKNRCYICKKNILTNIKRVAGEHGIYEIMEGSNLDDTGDYRPGMQAVCELTVRSPLKELGFTKADIRNMSKKLGLPTWEKPSLACLASRIPYGDAITRQKLEMIESAENILYSMGFCKLRVRLHGKIARIEVPESSFDKVIEKRNDIINEFKKSGFLYVTLDIEGYRTGSMNV